MARFYRYPDDAPDTRKLVHSTLYYVTPAGNPATWSRWVYGADDLDHAYTLARRHVETFKRCARINGGSSSPYMGPARHG